MNADEYRRWTETKQPRVISMRPLNGETRSLLFGTQLGGSGERIHVFQHRGNLHVLRFRQPTPEERQEHDCDAIVVEEHIGKELKSSLLTGNERWWAEMCDFAFCSKIDQAGIDLEILPHRGARDLVAAAAEGHLATYTHVPELELYSNFKAVALSHPGYPLG